jgi:hypothetical protein
MSTHDVPGANPAHADVLAAGCWAEHDDGSLIYVKGTENDQVVYEIYDVMQEPPVYYQDAMRKDAFERQFSYKQGDVDEWTWHDKTLFPWGRVMKTFDKPAPMAAAAEDTLSAAARVADSLRLRAKQLEESDIPVEKIVAKGKSIMGRLERAFEAFVK